MQQRYVTIWFRYLKTDWFIRRQPSLANVPFVLYAPDHGRMVVTAANKVAEKEGIYSGTVLADARAIITSIHSIEEKPAQFDQLITHFAQWFIRYSPVVATDGFDGLIIDATGCAHLWGGEEKYLEHISNRLLQFGYTIHIAMASTIGAAWAHTRYGINHSIIDDGKETESLLQLPAQALRISNEITERLYKLGLKQIGSFLQMPSSVLSRRFGKELIQRLNQALGFEEERLRPVIIQSACIERLNCFEPVATRSGIEIALINLLGQLCRRLLQEQKGIRTVVFTTYRVDGKMQSIQIGTNRSTINEKHLFKLFEQILETIEPGLGIELFLLEATKLDAYIPAQEKLWSAGGGLQDPHLAQLLDRLANKIGMQKIHRYLPDEHYWPERSLKKANSLDEMPTTNWNNKNPRPVMLLTTPASITVAAPVPDYPPMLFRYKGKVHKIIKADGPERMEQEWWLQEGEHRDYYYVEDEEGHRYWLFRLGHYEAKNAASWYLHGYCA
jgi:protein ImuB